MEQLPKNANETFKQIVDFPNYYVSDQGRVYNTKTNKFIGRRHKGLIRVHLRDKGKELDIMMHYLVMRYFNDQQPEDKTKIIHLNGDGEDNDIKNLMWASQSDIQKLNAKSHKNITYEFFDEIPADYHDIIEVKEYKQYRFDNLYFADGYFYVDTNINFKRLYIIRNKVGKACVNVRDKDNHIASIAYDCFKKLYKIN